jgi:hypothetical protein
MRGQVTRLVLARSYVLADGVRQKGEPALMVLLGGGGQFRELQMPDMSWKCSFTTYQPLHPPHRGRLLKAEFAR